MENAFWDGFWWGWVAGILAAVAIWGTVMALTTRKGG